MYVHCKAPEVREVLVQNPLSHLEPKPNASTPHFELTTKPEVLAGSTGLYAYEFIFLVQHGGNTTTITVSGSVYLQSGYPYQIQDLNVPWPSSIGLNEDLIIEDVESSISLISSGL